MFLNVINSSILIFVITNIQTKHINGKNDGDWSGPWFPHTPKIANLKRFRQLTQVVDYLKCDNFAQDDVIEDVSHYRQDDERSSYSYLCFDEGYKYVPKYSTNAIIKEYYVPPTYRASVKCFNEVINYNHYPPTFGSYHAVFPKIGFYRYLPPETWLGDVAIDIVVMLYHPCAFLSEVKRLHAVLERNILNNYLITMTQHLTPQRPMALITWSRILLMSTVEENVIIDFIKEINYNNVVY